MVPLEAPPVTLQETAVFEVPVTVAVNCCVIPTDTLAVAGIADTATEVLFDEPAHPKNRIETQARAHESDVPRMKILTGGAGSPFSNAEIRKQSTPRVLTHELGLRSWLKRCSRRVWET